MSDRAHIVLSSPGVGMFVQQTGRALYEAGMLKRFVTTLGVLPNARWRRQAPSGLRALLNRRAVSEFPIEFVLTHPLRELLRLFAREMDCTGGVLTDRVWEWAERGFDDWVAKRGLAGAQAVYAYEHAALSTFKAAKERGITCIYDVPSPEHEFAQRVRDEEVVEYPELDNAYQRRTRRCCARRTLRRRGEWAAADIIFAGSEFTRSTYAAAGLDVSKVRVIAPGAPPVCPEAPDRLSPSLLDPVRFLFVGAVAIHKGAHHLLAAWRLLHPPQGTATLEIIGDVSLPRSILHSCPNSVKFTGQMSSERVFEHYRRADALVFPTLCDGFGMVVTEAFSQGLPVITTPRAGAADLVREGVNGFIVPAADPEALAHRLEWCLGHRVELHAMRAAARATAAAWQWSDYRRRLMEEILLGVHGSAYLT